MSAKTAVAGVLIASVIVSCAVQDSFVSKKRHGNLEIEVTCDGKPPTATPELRVDGRFVGHVSVRRPVIYLTEGKHSVEVTCPGYSTWQRDIYIAGEPNHQYLHVRLRPEGSGGR